MQTIDLTGAAPGIYWFRTKPRQWWAITLVWALSVALSVSAWFYFSREQPFDAESWNNSAKVDKGVRLKMADYLIDHGTLSGRTRDQVVAMLGVPPATEYFGDWDLVYWLGPERGFISVDSEWLVVRFDDDNHVAEYRIVRD